MIINIVNLLKGYKIIYFYETGLSKAKKVLILAVIGLVEILTYIYIAYYIPFFDNFYFGINLIKHLAIMAIGVKMFLTNFISLYKQYRLERRIRTILTLSYKYKLIIYSKVFIFTFFYCLGFIIINIISINSQMEYPEDFVYIYYLNIALELFFANIFSIIFFPLRNSILYFSEVNYDYNSIKFIAEIKNNKNIGIDNLNRKILEEQYRKKEYPLVLVEPFSKSDNLFNNSHLHIGIVKNN